MALVVVRVVGFLRLHHEYHHCVSSVFASVVLNSSSWCQNTKSYAFSGHFYRSLAAPRLSDFLDADLQLNNDNSRYNERFSYTVRSRLKREVGQRLYLFVWFLKVLVNYQVTSRRAPRQSV